MTCTASGKGLLLFGDNTGVVYVMTRTFDLGSFKAYEDSVQLMTQVKSHNVVITVGVRTVGCSTHFFLSPCLTLIPRATVQTSFH